MVFSTSLTLHKKSSADDPIFNCKHLGGASRHLNETCVTNSLPLFFFTLWLHFNGPQTDLCTCLVIIVLVVCIYSHKRGILTLLYQYLFIIIKHVHWRKNKRVLFPMTLYSDPVRLPDIATTKFLLETTVRLINLLLFFSLPTKDNHSNINKRNISSRENKNRLLTRNVFVGQGLSVYCRVITRHFKRIIRNLFKPILICERNRASIKMYFACWTICV